MKDLELKNLLLIVKKLTEITIYNHKKDTELNFNVSSIFIHVPK